MADELLATYERFGGWLQVKVVEYRGKKKLDIRLMAEDNGDLIPTKKGVQIDEDELVDFKEAVDKAIVEIKGGTVDRFCGVTDGDEEG